MTWDRQREAPKASRAFISRHQISTQRFPAASHYRLLPEYNPLCCHTAAGKSFFTAGTAVAPAAASSSSPCRKKQPFLLRSLVKLLNKSRLVFRSTSTLFHLHKTCNHKTLFSHPFPEGLALPGERILLRIQRDLPGPKHQA